MINWDNIQSVFLDMDGTLLDLNFDNYFWQEHLPARFAEQNAIDLDQAKAQLFPRFRALEGSMEWYCVDHWTQELGMDIALMKEEVAHLIAIHPHVIEFLHALRKSGRRSVLVTNAHQKSLALKMKHTRLGKYLDDVICAHELGLPKENDKFWKRLQTREPFDVEKTLLIDDNLAVLRAAREFGIANLLAVYQPDTKRAPKHSDEFPVMRDFRSIMPDS